jgi:(1->4)-alpha-D-glucan 1-alpha-D-glucosylmutase
VIEAAMKVARMRGEGKSEAAAFDFVQRLLLLETAELGNEAGAKRAREFVMKFQQLTGPAMAKGLEDTAFYRFNRLVSLNEVGGEPGKFGVSPAEFHEANAAVAKQWGHTLLASATHDTKRGEDVRARLNVLSEIPAEWCDLVMRWRKTIRGEDGLNVAANDEYLLYQTLVGAWPGNLKSAEAVKGFRERVGAFMLKAVKEAKEQTSWTEPNSDYEGPVQCMVGAALEKAFLQDFQSFARRISFFGRFNSLAQTLLKIASPGVPDFYQGCELWDLNLADSTRLRRRCSRSRRPACRIFTRVVNCGI